MCFVLLANLNNSFSEDGLKRVCFCRPQRRKKDAGIKDSSCLTIALLWRLAALVPYPAMQE